MVARRRRPAGYHVAAGPQPHVLGGAADRPPQRAPFRAAPQRVRRHAAVRLVLVVGRCLLHVGNAESARADRDQHGPDRDSLLGNGHRRLRPHEGVHGRALCAVVPIRRVQHAVPLARPQLEAAASLGMEHRRPGPDRDQQLQRRGVAGSLATAQRRGRAGLPQVPRAALPLTALSLQHGPRMHPDRNAGDSRDVAALSRRPVGGGSRRSVPLGPRRASRSDCGTGRDGTLALPAGRHVV